VIRAARAGRAEESEPRERSRRHGHADRQRRTHEVAKRRELLHDIQRYLAKQQYYAFVPSGIYVAVWDGALKTYGPNVGYDYGGRLMAAWLDR
jgi:hypothetical protein